MNKAAHMAFLSACLDGETRISTGWLKQNSFAAMPVETPINWMDAEWLASACKKNGIATAYAVKTYDVQESPIFSVQMDQESIYKFFRENSETAGQSILLFPPSYQFAYLTTRDDYMLFCGPRDFVRECIGCSFRTARKIFDEYAEGGFDWSEKMRSLVQEIASQYRPFGAD